MLVSVIFQAKKVNNQAEWLLVAAPCQCYGDTVSCGSCPVFLPPSEAPCETLPACFLLKLHPAITMMESFVNKLSRITGRATIQHRNGMKCEILFKSHHTITCSLALPLIFPRCDHTRCWPAVGTLTPASDEAFKCKRPKGDDGWPGRCF